MRYGLDAGASRPTWMPAVLGARSSVFERGACRFYKFFEASLGPHVSSPPGRDESTENACVLMLSGVISIALRGRYLQELYGVGD